MVRLIVALALATLAAPAAAAAQAGDAGRVAAVLDDWHAAAAAADEKRYFGHLAEDAIFLGTDATERWTKKQFYDYAHPFFAKGRAWSFRATRRDVSFSKDGALAWFDEDLATENLGPCRGSGVLRLENGTWRIVHYNLAVTVPNEVFDDVKKVIDAGGAKPPASQAPSGGG